MPLRLGFAHTRLAGRDETRLLHSLLRERCAAVGSGVHRQGDRLIFELHEHGDAAQAGWLRACARRWRLSRKPAAREGRFRAVDKRCLAQFGRSRSAWSVHELVQHGVEDRLAGVAVGEYGDAPTALRESGDEGSPTAVGAVVADHAHAVGEGS